MSKFKFCKDDGTWEWKNLHPDDEGFDDGLSQSSSLREIAYQLKRIADFLERSKK